MFFWVGENERLSTSGPIRCRGVEKAANSSRGGRRPVWATPRVLNGLGGLDFCLNRSLADTVRPARVRALRGGLEGYTPSFLAIA